MDRTGRKNKRWNVKRFIIKDWADNLIKFKNRSYPYDSFDDAEEVLCEEIDIYFNGDYLHSTKESASCTDAIVLYLYRLNCKFAFLYPDKLSPTEYIVFKNWKLVTARYRGELK